jgi:hypothetical protein
MPATRRAWAARAHQAKVSDGLALRAIRITRDFSANIDEAVYELQFLKIVRIRVRPTDSSIATAS